MKRAEFAEAIAWLTAAIGKSLVDGTGDKAEAERTVRMNVYFECLGDLPIEAFRIACKRCAMERKYQSFPPIAELRELATETKQGEVKAMTGIEAFGIALRVCGNCDVESPGSVERAMSGLPPLLRQAIRRFGFHSLYNMRSDAIETARAQFARQYDAMAERERKAALLPETVRRQIDGIAERWQIESAEERAAIPLPVKALVEKIGAAP